MHDRVKIASGSPFEDAVGYSRAVRVGSLVAVAGTTAPGSDPASQAREILRRIAVALDNVGATLSDVVRTRIFVTDIAHWQPERPAPSEQERQAVPRRCAAGQGLCDRRRAGWPADGSAGGWTGARTLRVRARAAGAHHALSRPSIPGRCTGARNQRSLPDLAYQHPLDGVTRAAVIHDTPVNPRGTRPKPQASDTVEPRRYTLWRCHDRNAHQS